MTTNTIRITKAQKFNAIIDLLNGKDAVVIEGKDGKESVTLDADYLIQFCKAELNLLAKKNTSDKKSTQTQKDNEDYKALILDFLRAQSEPVTCTDIQKGVPAFAGFNNQKIAALVRQLADALVINRVVVKGKSLFSIA